MVHEQRIGGANMNLKRCSDLSNLGSIMLESFYENSGSQFQTVCFDLT